MEDHLKEKTDEQLIPLILEDQNIYAIIIERYEDKLMRYIKRISNLSTQDSQDILQEIFIKVYQNLNDFDQNLKFSSWIYRITHNETISYIRRLKNKVISIDNEEFNEETASSLIQNIDFDKEIDFKNDKKIIHDILQQMDEKYKEVLILRYLEDKDYKEISDILKKPVSTVGTLINRAKKQFKVKVQKLDIEFHHGQYKS